MDRLISTAQKDYAGNEYWLTGYENYIFQRQTAEDNIYQFIRKYFKKANGDETAIELGSYPGTYISEFGELGYEINGIDIHPGNSSYLKVWLESKGYKIGKFISEDLFEFNKGKRYDIVSSFGLIEHFSNYLELIDKHDALLKKGGKLVITTPNYRGFIQKFLHRCFDYNDYKIHYIPAMQPEIWAKHLAKKGYKIEFSGYFGRFSFWVRMDNKSGLNKFLLIQWFRFAKIVSFFVRFESKHFSRFCGIVATKTK
jgi:SAM-dependent methyltransferase